MITRSTTTLLLWLAVAIAATAQTTGSLKGRVTDAQGKPVPGATVRILGTSPLRGGITRTDGSFMVAGIRPGEYDVKADALGFGSVTKPNVRISVDRISAIDFTLVAEAPGKEQVAVTHPTKTIVADPYRRRDGYSGRVLIRSRPEFGFRVLTMWDVELQPELAGGVERERPSAATVDIGRVTTAPTRRYRPGIAASRIFSLRDSYMFPGNARWLSIDDPFTGGFRYYPVVSTLVDSRSVEVGPYDVGRRDVVEPSMERRWEWIRGYEEHRDMMSPFERDLASWTRRR